MHNDSLLYRGRFGQSDLNIRGSCLVLRGEIGGCGSVSLKVGYDMKGRDSAALQRRVALGIGS
jgi:hypothetical protein